MTTPTTPEGRRELKADIDKLPPRPWTVWTSNSFRRITGPDGKDGSVLHAYAQRSDGHPDLSMPEEQLEALCRVVNAAPSLLAALEEAEGREAGLREEASAHETLLHRAAFFINLLLVRHVSGADSDYEPASRLSDEIAAALATKDASE